MCKYGVNNAATQSQHFMRNWLNQGKKPHYQRIYSNILTLSSELQVKWLLVYIQLTKHPCSMCLISFLSSKKTTLQAECSQPGECRCVCVVRVPLLELTLMIRFMQTNSIYWFVIFIWKMRRICHPQFKLMNYWPIVSDVEPLGSAFQCTGL